MVIENHHAPLVDAETFNTAKKLIENRRRPDRNGDFGILNGLLFCADCGYKLYSASYKGFNYYICSYYKNTHGNFNKKCSRHSIRREVVEKIVLSKIREISTYACENKEAFAAQIHKLTNKDRDKVIKSKTAELSKAEHRKAELHNIIKKTYENNILGKLSDELFTQFLKDYEAEKSEMASKAVALRAEIEELQSKAANVQNFIKIAERYAEIPELTAEIARSFIEKIVVHEAERLTPKGQVRSQKVQIYFNCIGEFELE